MPWSLLTRGPREICQKHEKSAIFDWVLWTDSLALPVKLPSGKSGRTPNSKVHGPTWGPSGADRTQVGPMLAPWTLLSGTVLIACQHRCLSAAGHYPSYCWPKFLSLYCVTSNHVLTLLVLDLFLCIFICMCVRYKWQVRDINQVWNYTLYHARPSILILANGHSCPIPYLLCPHGWLPTHGHIWFGLNE